jgi:hypothetical protein
MTTHPHQAAWDEARSSMKGAPQPWPVVFDRLYEMGSSAPIIWWEVHVKADLGEWIEAGVWSTLAGALRRPPYPWERTRVEMHVRFSSHHSLNLPRRGAIPESDTGEAS